MNKKLLVFTQSGGRFGNQVFIYVHLYAFWLKNNRRINFFMISFWPYISYMNFSGPARYGYHNADNKHNYVFRFLFFIYSILPKRFQSSYHSFLIYFFHSLACFFQSTQSVFCRKTSVPENMKKLGQDYCGIDLTSSESDFLMKKNTVLAGFIGYNTHLRSWSLCNKYYDHIIKHFQFAPSFYKNSTLTLKNLLKYKVKVGVHIRQGDYKAWGSDIKGISVYFNISTYIKKMKEIAMAFSHNDIIFLVTSDEHLDEKQFCGLNIEIATGSVDKGGHYIESIIQLSHCDFILMPYTTFGGFASFLGNSKILFLASGNDNININDYTDFEYVHKTFCSYNTVKYGQ